MSVLALDTSSAIAVAVAGENGQILAQRALDQERRHVEGLAPMMREVLIEAGLSERDLRHVVVGTGPAPFTGLRVGIVTARAFAFALGIPVYGISGLDAIAALAATELGLAPGTEILVATDAKRREVYWARYVVRTTALSERGHMDASPGATPPEPLLDEQPHDDDSAVRLSAGPGVDNAAALVAAGLVDRAVVVGPGAHLFRDVFAPAALDVPNATFAPEPAVLARLAEQALASGTTPGTEPLYLRRPDAQEPAARKRATR